MFIMRLKKIRPSLENAELLNRKNKFMRHVAKKISNLRVANNKNEANTSEDTD